METERFETFANHIGGIYWDIQKLKAKWNEKLGLKSVHIFWVYLLRKHPEGLSSAELSRHSQSNRSLVSREIRELIDMGHVAYRQDQENQRHGKKLVLTPSGWEISEFIRNTSLEIQNTVNDGIPMEDLIVFYRTLTTLQRRFDMLVQE